MRVRMNIRKSVFFAIIILVIAMTTISIVFVFWGDKMHLARSSRILSEYINQGKIENLSLVIYYFDPTILTLFPVSIDSLIAWANDNKITVNSVQLEENIDLVNQMINTDLLRVRYGDDYSYIDARIYYVFETKKGQKVFDVAMWCDARGDYESIVVNGVNVKTNEIFYHVILPFLPEEAAKTLENYIGLG